MSNSDDQHGDSDSLSKLQPAHSRLVRLLLFESRMSLYPSYLCFVGNHDLPSIRSGYLVPQIIAGSASMYMAHDKQLKLDGPSSYLYVILSLGLLQEC
eukprot:762630-Hanusia_phi.AAC.3